MSQKWAMARTALRHISKASPGRCPCCHQLTAYVLVNSKNLREGYWCVRCRSLGRNRLVALGLTATLPAPNMRAIGSTGLHKDVYIAATSGAIFTHMPVGTPQLTTSDYIPSVEWGSVLPDGHSTSQSLEGLTYDDRSFDIVITEDVLEHVRDPDACFSEIHRVLRPGGAHIFTVPWRPDLEQILRVDTSGPEDVRLLPDEWHGDVITGRILAYRTFGYGIFAQMAKHGFETELLRPSLAIWAKIP